MIPRGRRLLIHMVRPVGVAHPDFSTLDRLPGEVSSLEPHPQLRGYLDVRPGDRLASVYAVFDVKAPTTAQAIVDAIRRLGPRDASFSLAFTNVATVEELRRQTAESLRQTVESLPFVGPAAVAARKVAESDVSALLWMGLAVGGTIGLAWLVQKLRGSRERTVYVESKRVDRDEDESEG